MNKIYKELYGNLDKNSQQSEGALIKDWSTQSKHNKAMVSYINLTSGMYSKEASGEGSLKHQMQARKKAESPTPSQMLSELNDMEKLGQKVMNVQKANMNHKVKIAKIKVQGSEVSEQKK